MSEMRWIAIIITFPPADPSLHMRKGSIIGARDSDSELIYTTVWWEHMTLKSEYADHSAVSVWKQDDTTLCVFYDPNEGQGEKGLVSNKISAEHR